jgi:hypothetical protein
MNESELALDARRLDKVWLNKLFCDISIETFHGHEVVQNLMTASIVKADSDRTIKVQAGEFGLVTLCCE